MQSIDLRCRMLCQASSPCFAPRNQAKIRESRLPLAAQNLLPRDGSPRAASGPGRAHGGTRPVPELERLDCLVRPRFAHARTKLLLLPAHQAFADARLGVGIGSIRVTALRVDDLLVHALQNHRSDCLCTTAFLQALRARPFRTQTVALSGDASRTERLKESG